MLEFFQQEERNFQTKNLLLWLERYCEAHPGKSTDEALHELVKELYPTRLAYPG